MRAMVSQVVAHSTVVSTGCWGTITKTSKLSIIGPLWGEWTGDWTDVLPNNRQVGFHRNFLLIYEKIYEVKYGDVLQFL